jgi:hypothetical protein
VDVNGLDIVGYPFSSNPFTSLVASKSKLAQMDNWRPLEALPEKVLMDGALEIATG